MGLTADLLLVRGSPANDVGCVASVEPVICRAAEHSRLNYT